MEKKLMTKTVRKTYSFYPGCSLERNAYAYLQSTEAIAKPLGIEWDELEDWNCCGATEYISLELLPAFALIGRNLAIAEAQKEENGSENLVAPCSACYINLRKTDHYLRESQALTEQVNEALEAGGLHYTPGSVNVRHLLDVVVNDIGYDAVREKVVRPLTGLRVAPYYGCFILRPDFAGIDNPEYPTILDKLLEALGAEVVDYPVKGQCCGGHMTQISESTSMEMIHYLIKAAADAGADAIATVCPMCQLNLDAFQGDMNRHFKTDYRMPVLYFTQLMGLSFGLTPRALGIGKGLVSAQTALSKIEDEALHSEELARSAVEDLTEIPSSLLDAGRWTATAKFWSLAAGFWKLVGDGMKGLKRSGVAPSVPPEGKEEDV
jgi:heterodisulfide reductase subunit B